MEFSNCVFINFVSKQTGVCFKISHLCQCTKSARLFFQFGLYEEGNI